MMMTMMMTMMMMMMMMMCGGGGDDDDDDDDDDDGSPKAGLLAFTAPGDEMSEIIMGEQLVQTPAGSGLELPFCSLLHVVRGD